MRAKRRLAVGDRVRLTGRFLRSTGQETGHAGLDRWEILGFDRDWAIVNEPTAGDYFTAEELSADPSLKWRRVAIGNLERVGG